MYLIALCDDEAEELNKAETMLNVYRSRNSQCDFVIERFESADELHWMVKEKNYMPDISYYGLMEEFAG